ncbi:MAG: autotransporter domain-containing protein [Mesorhizobium sp.]|nr:autotransporter outer membrane beta-barrel domain-containing protein [Mesorhizobium sp.]MBL8578758.1 autotransporter domain-containing protein [Mesorhizobium sp.]
MQFRAGLSCGVALGAFLAADGALAQTVVTVGRDEVLGNVNIPGDGTVTNNGTVLGDVFISDDGTVTNTGTIGGGVLILNDDFVLEGHTVTNSGTIGGDVVIEGGTITNTGTIVGIARQTGFGTITNSGSLGGAHVFVPGTLNLLAGSVIHGGIDFSFPGSTLNLGHGQNMALTLTGSLPAINSFGAPMAVQGLVVAVVDPTGFSAQDEMLTDLTRAIANAVDGRINSGRFGYAPAAPVLSYAAAGSGADTQPAAFGYPMGSTGATSSGYGFWASGIGAWRDQDADGADTGFDTSLGGLLVGLDGELANGMRLGGFLGASTSRFETDPNSQEIDADSYFGGVYGSYAGQNYFLDASLTGGVSQQSSDRTVANNLVLGGIEHATADYDGVFISPSATIGTTFAMANGSTFIPSFRARYAGLFLDGYDESGSAANLSVDDRDVNIFDLRAQLAYALAALPSGNGAVHATFRIGADATFADNANVDANLLGTALNFDVSGDDTVRGFAGIDLNYRAEGGMNFFLGAEAGYDSGNAFTLDVNGGLRIPL